MISAFPSEGGVLPTDEQRLILDAVLKDGQEALDAAIAWLDHADIENLAAESRRLLPMLYARLKAANVQHWRLPLLKGYKNHTSLTNRLLLHRGAEVIRALHDARIDVMIIKGGALLIEYYKDYGLRPMGDVDILVRHIDARDAFKVLAALGWKPEDDWAEENGLGHVAREYYHGKHFIHNSGQALDLHWNLFQSCLGAEADTDFWAASNEILCDGYSIRSLDPADQLLHTCVHGAGWDLQPPIRWVPDAFAILKHSPQLDWRRFVSQTRKRQLSLTVLQRLEYLSQSMGQEVPLEVLTEIRYNKVSRFELLEYRQLQKPYTGLLGSLTRNLYTFLRTSRDKSLIDTLLSIPSFLCLVWRVPRAWMLPGAFFEKAASRMRAQMKRPSGIKFERSMQ